MPLKFHATIDDQNEKTCTMWIEEDGGRISNEVSGVAVRDIEDFFTEHPALMLGAMPRDFSTWLVREGSNEVSIAGDLAAYRALGFKPR
jgi:hypothetical protein